MTGENKVSWAENCAGVLSGRSQDNHDYDNFRIDQAKKILSQTETGRKILKWLDENNTQILLDHQADNYGGYIIPGSNTICLAPNPDPVQMAINLAHEARHIFQDAHGLIATEFTSIQEFAIQTRLIEADALAYELKVIDELKDIGYDTINTNHIEDSIETLEDMKKADPNYRENMSLHWAGFYSFFKSPRKDIYDRGAASLARQSFFEEKGERLESAKRFDGEFMRNNGYVPPECAGIDIAIKSQFILLSKDFDGGDSYLTEEHVDHILGEELFIGTFCPKTLKEFAAHKSDTKDRPKGQKTRIQYLG